MEPSLANRPKRAAAERAMPGIKAGVAREEAFQREAKRAKDKRARSNKRREAQGGQKGYKKESRQRWKNAGRGRDLDTGEYVGGTEVDGEEVVDAPKSLMHQYAFVDNRAQSQCNMNDLTRVIVASLSEKEEGVPAVVAKDLQREFNCALTKAIKLHEAESRIFAIGNTAIAKNGEKYYEIEKIGGGVLTADGGHVLGRKEDYDQGNINKPPSKEKKNMDYDFEEMCTSLAIIGQRSGVAAEHPTIIMEAKIEFKDKVEKKKYVDHCYIVDVDTCRYVLMGTYDLLGM